MYMFTYNVHILKTYIVHGLVMGAYGCTWWASFTKQMQIYCIWIGNGGICVHMVAHRCMTDAYRCIQMINGCIYCSSMYIYIYVYLYIKTIALPIPLWCQKQLLHNRNKAQGELFQPWHCNLLKIISDCLTLVDH